jgi:hypothetical protein
MCVSFLQQLCGVKFLCCDRPFNDTHLPEVLAAAYERSRRISDALRESTAKRKSRGDTFGFDASDLRGTRVFKRGARKGASNSAALRMKRARDAYRTIVPRVREWRASGVTWDECVDRLNAEGCKTTVGKPINRPTLIRILQRTR